MLYLRYPIPKASPKAISGRTSNLRVRLVFHLYPQLIPQLFNADVVRASTHSYMRFTLAMGSSLGFGSATRNYDRLAPETPISDSLSLRLRAEGP